MKIKVYGYTYCEINKIDQVISWYKKYLSTNHILELNYIHLFIIFFIS